MNFDDLPKGVHLLKTRSQKNASALQVSLVEREVIDLLEVDSDDDEESKQAKELLSRKAAEKKKKLQESERADYEEFLAYKKARGK